MSDEEALMQAGFRIQDSLQANSTSWVIMMTAVMFWRAQGNAKHAVDCAVRAIRYTPRDSMHITLVSLANVFFNAGFFDDAVTTMKMAIHVSSMRKSRFITS